LAGILLNTFFTQGLLTSAESIASNGGVLTKIYVPPQIFAISAALAGLVNFVIGFIPLTLVVYFSGQTISFTFPLAFVAGIFLTLFIAGLGLSISILFIRFDDTRNVVAVILLILTYLTPIFYPISILSETMQNVVLWNPLTSYLEIFRWAFSNNGTPNMFNWSYMIVSSLLALLVGIYSFRKYWPRTVAIL
jgi:ABC-type polysaccharide/polyol phosphate export permease